MAVTEVPRPDSRLSPVAGDCSSQALVQVRCPAGLSWRVVTLAPIAIYA